MSNPAIPAPGQRWLPAALGVLLLAGGFAGLSLKIIRMTDLRRENTRLRAAADRLPELRQQHDELERLRSAARQAESAGKEREELAKLRAEVEQLRANAAELPALRDEARRLQAERAAAAARAGAQEEPDPLAETKGRADRIACVSNLKQVCLAALVWAHDRGQNFPASFLTMSNELNTPKILTCPGDKSRQRAENWTQFDGSSVSYEWLTPPGLPRGDPSFVITRCPLHNNVGLSDGSVQQLPPTQRVELVDGKYKIVRVNPSPGSSPP